MTDSSKCLWAQTIAAVVFVFLAMVDEGCAAGTSAQSVRPEIVVKLADLKPLPKVHYYWPPYWNLFDRHENPLLYQLARITHSVSVYGHGTNGRIMDRAVYACAKVNKTRPSIAASVAIVLEPWHRRYRKISSPMDRGREYHAELLFFETQLRRIKQWVAAANRKYGADVKISAILLDAERFKKKPDNKRWNDAMREALDEIHIRVRAACPKARIEWYGRGIRRLWGRDGWSATYYFTGNEIPAPLSCSLYTVPEIQRMREVYHRTCRLADSLGIEDVTPWVALASGYRRGVKKAQTWDFNWPYDLIYSHQLGAELNIPWYGDRPKRFAPYNRAKVVIFYPRPFEPKTPHWVRHFIAYVRGATGVKKLDDLGYDK